MRRGFKSNVALIYAASVNRASSFTPRSFPISSRQTVNYRRGAVLRKDGCGFSSLASGNGGLDDGVDGPRGFESLGLRPELLQAVTKLGYEGLTDIQDRALPPALAGSDVVGKAKTGSGKTAVFGLALLQKLDLSKSNRGGRPQALVLSPTRELTSQLVVSIRGLAASMAGVRVLGVTGGVPSRDQRSALERGAHVVVATPGRCLRLLEDGHLDPMDISCLVMDEADTLLDMGFEEEVNRIMKFLPPSAATNGRQTLLFSATWGERVENLSGRVQLLPEVISDGDARGVVSGDDAAAQVDGSLLRQSALLFEGGEKNRLEALSHALNEANVVEGSSCVVFCETKVQCNSVAGFLKSRGASALELHGDLEQRDRERTLVRFRNKSCRILVATNVASRGLDVEGVSLVVVFQLNDDPDVHVHRIGRTARADTSGEAVSLVSVSGYDNEVSRLDAVNHALRGNPIARNTWNPQSKQDNSDLQLHGWKAEWSTLLVQGGRKDKLRPGDVLGAISGVNVGIQGKQVGKIDVTEKRTWVAVHHSVAAKAAEALGKAKIKKRKFKVYLMD